MARLVVFPSVLGARPGFLEGVERLRDGGHEVCVVDVFDGRTFDDYEPAMAFAEGELGHPVLMQRALDGVADLPDGFAVLGMSLGCVLATHVATLRAVSGIVMVAGVIPPAAFGDGRGWPAGVDAQVHMTIGDPWREDDMLALAEADAASVGASLEVFDYPGTGHLFMDPTLPSEYDAASAELLWGRVDAFLDRVAS